MTLDAAAKSVETTERALIFRRTFNAPVEVLFSMFGAEHVDAWWAPKPFRCVTHSQDFRQGGEWRYSMVTADGKPTGSNIVATYQELSAPHRIVMVDQFVDENGIAIQSDYASTKTLDLIAKGLQSELVLHSEYPTEEGLQAVLTMGMVEGMEIALDQLSAMLTPQ